MGLEVQRVPTGRAALSLGAFHGLRFAYPWLLSHRPAGTGHCMVQTLGTCGAAELAGGSHHCMGQALAGGSHGGLCVCGRKKPQRGLEVQRVPTGRAALRGCAFHGLRMACPRLLSCGASGTGTCKSSRDRDYSCGSCGSCSALEGAESREGSMVWKPSDLAAWRSCGEAETKIISVPRNMSRATRAAAS